METHEQYLNAKLRRQEMFEMSVTGLASQNWIRCYDENAGQCVYSMEGDKVPSLHCAVGWIKLVPKRLNSFSIGALMNEGLFLEEDYEFLTDLQRAHDGSTDPITMQRSLVHFAKLYGLKVPSELEGVSL